MNTRTFALIFGIVFLIVGAGGFLTDVTLMAPHSDPRISVGTLFGYELGMFPVNVLHSIVHVLFGIWGLLAYKSLSASKGYFKAVAIIYALLTVMGLVPALNTTFGLIPLFGHDVWLHALLAVVAAYFGFVHRDTVGDRT
jgi:hypothetical protein